MIVYELPLPPSANNLFLNKAGRVKSKHYRLWRNYADIALLTQCPLRTMEGPVSLRLTIKDAGTRDLDNCAKALIDLLVHHRIIEDDTRKIVREIHMQWGEVDGARVEIARPDNSEWLPRKVQNRSAA